MASSGYYYGLYKNKRDEVKRYESNIKELRRILSNLTDTMGDEIREINNELDALSSDLYKSVRHNTSFTSTANAVANERESSVTADPHLSGAVSAIGQEISRVEGLKEQAERDRDYYWRKYEEKKNEEQAAFWNNIF